MSETATLQPELYVILPRGGDPSLLILPSAGGWTLPRLEREAWPESAFKVFEAGMALTSIAGTSVETLRCAYFAPKTADHGPRLVFVAQVNDAVFQAPSGARWLKSAELAGLALEPDFLRPVLETYFRELETGLFPPERPPWAYAGWRARASAWIAEHAELKGDIEVVRKWPISCLLKVPTADGMLFFKAVPPSMAREVGATRLLAEAFPHHVPSIVAFDPAERWLLMRDFGPTVLGESKNPDAWTAALEALAALQIGMADRTDALLDSGALDYRLETLPAKFDALLADAEAMQPDRHISAAELARVRDLAPRLKALIGELAAYGLPPTIVHSDLHPWNIALRDGTPVFFDWTDVSVGHPFFDTALLFDVMTNEIFIGEPDTARQLREAYLAAAAPFAPAETLRAALPLGEVIGLLQQAVNYHHLLKQVEPGDRWTLSYTGFCLKRMLAAFDKLS